MGTDNRKGILYAIFTASLWGFMAIILKVITNELSPITVVWFRFFFAFLVLGTWTLIFRRKDFRIFLHPPALLLLAALFLALNYTGFIAGIKYVSPSISSGEKRSWIFPFISSSTQVLIVSTEPSGSPTKSNHSPCTR